MPSLLSRFLGKKKNADQTSLLDGEKFEAVPKTTSPVAPTFTESTQRPKSKGTEQSSKGDGKRQKRSSQNTSGIYDSKHAESAPVLALRLPESKGEEKKSSGLGVVFEGMTDAPTKLDEKALGHKRLTPSETLVLVQKTSEVINQRGLETLGVMRPHWFASPRQQEVQLKLIDRFLQTLSPQQADAPSPSQSTSFESELRYSQDPHDVAAVFRWGLRHLQLERNAFGSSGAGDWYRTFSESERAGSFPSKAFDDILAPLLPAAHTNLLRAILDMVSSLAAHSEENGISGNKLSKVLGWWIVSSRNIQGSSWQEFYAQWETAARQFEHLFLAYIRTQQAQSRMPKRLTELVKNYPFAKNRREEDGIYLPRPQFSTRSADALFIRITAEKLGSTTRPHPLRIVEDAFSASADRQSSTGEYMALWEEIRKMASKVEQAKEGEQTDGAPTLNLTMVLADESIRLLTLVPTPDGDAAPSLSLYTPLPSGRARRSLSVGDKSPTTPTANGRIESTGHTKAATSSQGHNVTPDWQLFSSSGFNSPSGLSLAASLWDNDTEVTQPTSKKSLGTGKRTLAIGSTSPRSRSADLPAPSRPAPESASDEKPGRFTYGVPHLVKLDEAFIDFWADSLLDSIACTWPTFVVCQLKSVPAFRVKEGSKPIEWLIIERVSAEPAHLLPAIKTSSASARAASPVPPSPTGSERGKSSRWGAATLGGSRKRWSFFSPKHESAPAIHGGRDRAAKNAARDHKVGEMGEIIKEEDEGKPSGVEANGSHEPQVPKQEVVPPPPAIQVNGVSKLDQPVTTEKAGLPAKSEPSTVAKHPVQGPAIVKDAVKEQKPAAEPVISQAPPVVETTPEAPPFQLAPNHAPAADESSAVAPSISAVHTPASPKPEAPVANVEVEPPAESTHATLPTDQVADAPSKAQAEPSDTSPEFTEPKAAPPSQNGTLPAESQLPTVPEPVSSVVQPRPEPVDEPTEEPAPAPTEPQLEEAPSTEPDAVTTPEAPIPPESIDEPMEPSAPVLTERAEQAPTQATSEPAVDQPDEEHVEPNPPSHDDPLPESAQAEVAESEPSPTAHHEATNVEAAAPPPDIGSEMPHSTDGSPAVAESEQVTTEDTAKKEAEVKDSTTEHSTEA